ncbi:WXG100 family type VII secretion target [Actinoplanes sp. TFC3]|uniref:WXG100 family type VII secretion target n=1 Tax=Actinoplanes sp. TFC3 TaxID=1710355 RepID=UPI000836CFA5|nr:hypothetical protein [Actinoplanes sp. TFC3]
MTNPLVAAPSSAGPGAAAGIAPVEDIQQIYQAVQSGSWVDGALGVAGGALDALAFVSDPVGALLQYGVAWIIEHVKPLSEALDWLAGDPSQITAQAQTWRNIANRLAGEADTLSQSARWDTAGWEGVAGEAYRAHATRRATDLQALSQASETMALITEGAGMLVGTVRIMVRDAITTVVSRLISYAIEELATLGHVQPEPGVHDVVVHGEPNGTFRPGVVGEDGGKYPHNYTNPEQITQAVRDNPTYVPGQPVRLISCHTGRVDADPDVPGLVPAGQQVADSLGAPEVAPTQAVGVPTRGDGKYVPRIANRPDLPEGKWVTFWPRNTGS